MGPVYSPVSQTPDAGPPDISEADPNVTSGANGKSDVVQAAIVDQHEKPQLTEPAYRAISTIRSAILLGYIIAGNCLCSGIICLCIWGFSKITKLSQWEMRAFNTLSLLLSAALGFGIGFLLDRIGLMARGTLLQSKSHTVKEVCTSPLVNTPQLCVGLMHID